MKTFLSGLVMMVLVVGFSSCQREVDFPTEEAEEILNDNIFLNKYVELDTAFASGLDTLYIDTFYYDAQKRLIKAIETYYESGVHVVEGVLVQERFYNGTDTVPYKIATKEEYTTGERYSDTTFLFYNNNKEAIKDSTINYEGAVALNRRVQLFYNDAPGRYYVKRTSLIISLGITSTDSVRMARTYTAGNMVSMADSAYLEGIGLAYVTRITANYDSKKSPFIKISLPYMVQQVDGSGITGANPMQSGSINNSVSYTLFSWAGGSPSTSTATIGYDYNSNNYPVIIRASSSSSPSEKMKGFFFYRAL